MSDESKTAAPAGLAAAAMQRDEARQEAAAQEAQQLLKELNKESEKEAPPAPAPEVSDAEARLAHEAAEAKRKEEFDKKRQERENEIQFAWEKAVDLPEPELIDASVKRLGDMTERLTRRNMKLCVTENIQTLCYEDLGFARMVMHPRKSMLNCFKYINRKAMDYLKQELKEIGEKMQGGVLGGDVPDELCYQWAEEYFRDMNAQEDKTDEDKEFVPKAYSGKSASKKKADRKPAAKKTEDKAVPKAAPAPAAPTPAPANTMPEQMALF